MARINRGLEARVAERTEELRARNQQIAAQARRLGEVDLLKRQLIANVSHELRTPLSAILTPLSALLPQTEGAVRRHLGIAVENAQRLQDLIGQLFELSRAQAGGVTLRARRVDLAELCREVLRRFEPAAQGVRTQLVAPDGAALPVMLISARQEVDDRVEGLEVADDYLAKPFQMPELIARARALLRRNAPPAPPLADRTPFLAELLACAEARLADRDFSTGALAKAMAMSPRTLQLRMVEHDLPAPNEWLRNLRVERAEALLRSGAAGSVGDAATAVGMDRAYFSRVYAARTGRPPSEDLR